MKAHIRKFMRSIGFDVNRHTISSSQVCRLAHVIRSHNIDLVFDVGANTGQFAMSIKEIGYRGRIVSFEPLPDAHQALSKVARRTVNWTVHDRCALGDCNGRILINVARNSASSSILQMLPLHCDAAPESIIISTEETPIYTLDSVAPQYLSLGDSILIKIDTQGFEWQVLDGASETLKRANGVLVELSLVPLYDGQRLWKDIIERLESEGFELWCLQQGFTDPRNGRTLQLDGIFFRK